MRAVGRDIVSFRVLSFLQRRDVVFYSAKYSARERFSQKRNFTNSGKLRFRARCETTSRQCVSRPAAKRVSYPAFKRNRKVRLPSPSQFGVFSIFSFSSLPMALHSRANENHKVEYIWNDMCPYIIKCNIWHIMCKCNA